jgi:DNA polymerase I-like protein with 3'-5' exonuclease and polymerase domains
LRLVYEEGSFQDHIFKIEYDETPYGEALGALRRLLDSCGLIVGFNLKFDLGWLKRYGIELGVTQRIFDLQLAYFILHHQKHPYPSLNECLSRYDLPLKSDVVEREYWSLGIDTPQVPLDILTDYLKDDLDRTSRLYCAINKAQQANMQLAKLHMQDLLVLLEMEYNGLCFDWVGMEQSAKQIEAELEELDDVILSYVPATFRSHFNTQSGDHLSALLYGGCISHRVGTPYQHTFQGGKQVGNTVIRHKWHEVQCNFPRQVEPIAGSELKKEGFYSTDEQTLTSLKTDKVSRVLVKALLSRSDKEKLLGTYLRGIPKILEECDWQDQLVHGTFNQCRVVTGRLSSEKPNQQNRPEAVDRFVITRFTKKDI